MTYYHTSSCKTLAVTEAA